MNSYRFVQLDMTQAEVREEYERLFYSCFVRVVSNRLIHTLWAWDRQEQRLATRIGYEDQVIFGVRDEAGKLESALACNVRVAKFQSAAFGFAPPQHATGYCEVLTFFSDRPNIKQQLELGLHGMQEMARRGFHTVYATSARHPLRAYLRTGWKLLQQATINGEERFFLAYYPVADALQQQEAA